MDNELKPCPFCGSTVEVCVLMGCAHISCKNCDISFKSNTTGMYVDKQIEKWNTRAPTDKGTYRTRIEKLKFEMIKIRSVLEFNSIDCLGTGYPSHPNDCAPWPIRDEVINGINQALLSAKEE